MDPDTTSEIQRLSAIGMAIRAIARKLGLDRKTVRKYIPYHKDLDGDSQCTSQVDRPTSTHRLDDTSPTRKTTKLTPFLTEVKAKVKLGLTGTRILREIQEDGYTGGKTILTDYVRTLRGKSKERKRYFRRFETELAEEAQVDWSPYQVSIAGRIQRVSCFSMILCNSRMLFIRFFRDEKLPTLLAAHVEAFRFFGGICRVIVYDNMTTVTLGRQGGEILWNPGFIKFARHYMFEPYLCRVRDPNRKGKVENPFIHVERDFLLGRKFTSWEELEQETIKWLARVVNCRLHGTTKKIPKEAWLVERDFLTALPEAEYPVYREELRPVYDDGLISLDGTKYSVPINGIGNSGSVMVRVHPHYIEVLNHAGQVVATHNKPDWPGGVILNPDHYASIKRTPKRNMGEMERRFLLLFPGTEAFLLGLKKRMKTLAHLHLRELFRLVGLYGEESVKAAIAHAEEYHNFNGYAVKRILGDRYPLISPDAQANEEGLTPPGGPGQIDDVEVGTFSEYSQYSRDEEEEHDDPGKDQEEIKDKPDTTGPVNENSPKEEE